MITIWLDGSIDDRYCTQRFVYPDTIKSDSIVILNVNTTEMIGAVLTTQSLPLFYHILLPPDRLPIQIYLMWSTHHLVLDPPRLNKHSSNAIH